MKVDFIITLMLVVFGLIAVMIAAFSFTVVPFGRNIETYASCLCAALGVAALAGALWLHVSSKRMRKDRGFT